MSREARPWVVIAVVLAVLGAVAWTLSRRWLRSDEFTTAIAGGMMGWVAGLLGAFAFLAAFITWRLRSDPD